MKGGAKWLFEPFSGIPGVIRGGPPLFLTKKTDNSGNETTITRQSNGRIQRINGSDGRSVNFTYGSNGFVSRMQDHTGRIQDYEYTSTAGIGGAANARVSKITDQQNRVMQYTYQGMPKYINTTSGNSQTACATDIVDNGYQGIASVKYPDSDTPTVNTYGTDRVVKQNTSTGQEWTFSYRRAGACVAKVLAQPEISGANTKTWDFTCRAGQPLASRTCASGQCTEALTGTCPDKIGRAHV